MFQRPSSLRWPSFKAFNRLIKVRGLFKESEVGGPRGGSRAQCGLKIPNDVSGDSSILDLLSFYYVCS